MLSQRSDRDDPPTDEEWRALTRVPQKRALFAEETYFREGWADLVAVFGAEGVNALGDVALLTFKPDAVPGRRLRPGVTYLAEHGFRPIGLRSVRQTRHSMRELWRHNWHIYPVDRLELSTLMHSTLDTLLLMLRDERYAGDLPASVRLSALKGSADPAQRRPGELREVLAPPNEVINFVHVADEPADVVRELGILLDRPARRAILETVAESGGEDVHDQLRAEIERLEASCEPHDFDPLRSLERAVATGAASRDAMARLGELGSSRQDVTWDELTGMIDRDHPDLSAWDLVAIGAAVLRTEREFSGEPLPDVDPAAWMKGAGPKEPDATGD